MNVLIEDRRNGNVSTANEFDYNKERHELSYIRLEQWGSFTQIKLTSVSCKVDESDTLVLVRVYEADM